MRVCEREREKETQSRDCVTWYRKLNIIPFIFIFDSHSIRGVTVLLIPVRFILGLKSRVWGEGEEGLGEFVSFKLV